VSEPDDATESELEGLSFGDAMDELTALVAELESDELDVDQLTTRVERAAVLVQWCRDRIDAARFSVEEVLVRLEEPSSE
jgi:exodeoxyribonuclease VII small subunit